MPCENPDHPKKAHACRTEAGDFHCSLHTMMVGEYDAATGVTTWSCVNSRCRVTEVVDWTDADNEVVG